MRHFQYPNFLIVGMERSGTHWVAALLNAHPDIACFPTLPFHTRYAVAGEKRPGEMHFFNTLASMEPNAEGKFTRPISDFLTKYHGIFADIVVYEKKVPKEEFYGLLTERYSTYCNELRGDKKIIGEGTPAYVFHLDFIDSLYPGIQKICSIRDPKDKIVSWHFSSLYKGRKKEQHLTPEFALGYLEKRIVKEYEALLAYTGHIHCFTYERMSTHTAQIAKGMVEYLGMPISDKILKHMVENAMFEKQTARESGSYSRRQGEEDRRSSFRKGIMGDWKNHIGSDLASRIDETVGDLRRKVFEKYNIEYSV